ncbi:hypothetical protein ABKN59_010604 [Abortiporus biennis]
MSSIIDAFKLKPYELEPVLAEWKSGPIYKGNSRKDPSVKQWLDEIKAGCIERKIPRDYWHKVGYHFMGSKARGRMDEVKKVMRNMHGGKYKWNWKAFKTAMLNMGWDIDEKKTEEIKVQSKPSGMWWIVGRSKDDSKDEKEATNVKAIEKDGRPHLSRRASNSSTASSRPTPKKARTFDFSKPVPPLPTTPKRSKTVDNVETLSSSPRSFFSLAKSSPSQTPASTPPAQTPASTPGGSVTTIAQAPVWLLNACQALDYLTTENPKVMNAISAVLITVGSIPAIPAISAGAGGAFLASGTAHALGSLAVGIGSLLRATCDAQQPAAIQGSAQISEVEKHK